MIFEEVGADGRRGVLRLIDSDILIDHLRGRVEARDFIRGCLAGEDPPLCSVVTHAELLAGMRSDEESQLRALLAIFEARPVDQAVAEVAGRYRREFGKSHQVELPDAIIAGTAFVAGAALFTTNIKHYPMTDIRVERPY